MNHPDEERLILAHFEGDRAVEKHLAECPSCGGRVEQIRRLLAAVEAAPVPERDESYGREVWRQIAPRLEERAEPGRTRFFAAPRLAFAGLAAAVMLAVVLAGRFWQEPSRAPLVASPQSNQRVLLFALGDHLDRSENVLIELINSAGHGGDAARESARAEELLAANRLYRQSAAASGERAVTDVLDDLERVLLEVAHVAATASPEELEKLRKRSGEGLLFKIRVLESRIREREREISPRNERKTT
jgi:hypothetical protein